MNENFFKIKKMIFVEINHNKWIHSLYYSLKISIQKNKYKIFVYVHIVYLSNKYQTKYIIKFLRIQVAEQKFKYINYK
jgi:hypothetical protein